jgi:methylglutaconyl-CoA hydratase
MTQFVRQDIDGSVATVTLNRPEIHNAFDEVMIGELTELIRSLGGRSDVRVIVLAAAGKSFSAGADLHWMKRMVDYSVEENRADARRLADMLLAIRETPQPVIARVHGAAFGGGVGLVAACDMAVALARGATFCLTEVRLGIIPAVICPFVMERIGIGPMRRYALTAERFDGAEARRLGLVSDVVETPEALDAWIATVARAIDRAGPAAVTACKRLLSNVADTGWDDVTERTARAIADIRVSAEGQEGLKAFLEKRPPAWAPDPPAGS